MLESIEKLLEFVGDMNATEINDHIKARPDGFVVSFRIDNEWLAGWNRAVLATVEKIEKEVSERYMELPVDADGVPIHVGDVMNFSKNVRNLFVLGVGIADATGDEWGVFVLDDRRYMWFNAGLLHHYHEPTVEGVLRDMCLEIDRRCERGSIDYDELFAEYAKRLRLAGDAE